MNKHEQLSKIIRESENIVFLGGAGVSTESGIPDFKRGKDPNEEGGGIAHPEVFLHHNSFIRNPEGFYLLYRGNLFFPNAKPNKAHYALARLEKEGKLSFVVTQNIDGLHQLAGSEKVLELHGSAMRYSCMNCQKEYGPEVIQETNKLPICKECGGLIRPDIVLYGEALDGKVWSDAEKAIQNADTLIVGGTSLVVYPAAGLVSSFHGKHLVILNQSPTPYDHLAELIIHEPIGEVLGKVVLDELYPN